MTCLTSQCSRPELAMLAPAPDRARSAGNGLHRRALTVGRLLQLALGVAFACALAQGLADAQSDREVPVPASGAAARTRIAEIRAYMRRVKNTFMATGRVHLYARVSGQTTLIRVPDSRRWPEATEASYNVVHDLRDRVVAFVEVPTSESGDWYNEYLHYFDADGRTLVFERSSSFFNGCPVKARERTISYFDPTGRLLSREYTLTAFGGSPVDASRCDFMYRYPYQIFRSWPELARSIGLKPWV